MPLRPWVSYSQTQKGEKVVRWDAFLSEVTSTQRLIILINHTRVMGKASVASELFKSRVKRVKC